MPNTNIHDYLNRYMSMNYPEIISSAVIEEQAGVSEEQPINHTRRNAPSTASTSNQVDSPYLWRTTQWFSTPTVSRSVYDEYIQLFTPKKTHTSKGNELF